MQPLRTTTHSTALKKQGIASVAYSGQRKCERLKLGSNWMQTYCHWEKKVTGSTACGTRSFYPRLGYFPQLAWSNNIYCRLEKIPWNRDVSSPAHGSRTDSQRVNPAPKQPWVQQVSFFSWILQHKPSLNNIWQSCWISMLCLSYYQVAKVILHKGLMAFCKQMRGEKGERRGKKPLALQFTRV